MATRGADGDAGRYRLTLIFCFLAALTEGFDVQSMGVAAPSMGRALGLARAQLGPVFSASIVGLLIGAVLIGQLADRAGRKRALVLSLAIFGLFSAVTAWAGNLQSLLAVRFLAGLGLGGAMPNLIALAAEAAPGARRVRVVTLVASGFPFGGALAAAIAALMGWRDIFYVGGVAPLILAALAAIGLPESRGFLAARQRETHAAPARADFPWILFGSGRAWTTLLLWAASFAGLLSLYLLLNWLPTLMGDKGVRPQVASLISVLFNVGGGLGVLIISALLAGGRRTITLAVWYGGVALSLLALAMAGPDLASAGVAGFATGAFASSAPIVLYGLSPGYYGVIMRGSGVGASVAVGRLGAIAGPLLAAALLAAGAGASGVLFALLPLVALSGGATLALLGRPTVAD
jgi:AAHS family 3-hydroxyphenylpropionic acid transporter